MSIGEQDQSLQGVQFIEQAASKQMHALGKLRLAQDPAKPCSDERRQQLLLEVREELMIAEHHLACARDKVTHQPGYITSLENHVSRLGTLRAKAEQLIQATETENTAD